VQITGGEPTLRRDLKEIVKELSGSGVGNIGMTTNGSRLNIQYASELVNVGVSDVHIHLPSLDKSIYSQTVRRNISSSRIQTLKDAAIYLKGAAGVEFNTPVTSINLPSLPQLFNFCYDNKINLKLIEEVKLSGEQISEEAITLLLEEWVKTQEMDPTKINIDGRYGKNYMFPAGFSFRVAPATRGLVSFLGGESDRVLYDGRYWIGGDNGKFLFTPSCFLEPTTGDFEDLKLNFEETRKKYSENGKK
jgi:cyclic pyranopterin phosphate synthase